MKGKLPEGEWIMGRNTLREILVHSPERILQVYTSLSGREDLSLFQDLKDRKIPINFVSKETLFSFVHSESHQSFVVKVKKRKLWELRDFLEKKREEKTSLLLLLDSIYDPQNFGAILRVAECFGVSGVIWSKNRGTSITPVVTKASSGGSEFVNLIPVSNLVESARKCKEDGYKLVVAEASEDAEELYSFSCPEKVLLILGSEGKGIQPLLQKQADVSVKIPLFGKISSLNVSQAAAIFCFYFLKRG